MSFPKPLKKDRPNIKARNERKRKDKEFQTTGKRGICAACGKTTATVKHHIVKRRFTESRWDESNAIELCVFHHGELHSGEKKFMEKYPMLGMRNETPVSNENRSM
jgi:5-methylcytosine-specific restriction endonuclease McrA